MSNTVPSEIVHLALSVKEACEHSSLGRTTFYKYMGLGKIPAHKCGNRTIVLMDELHQALMSLPRAGGLHEHE
jgi:excisionase family DNA binding protein